MPFELSSWAPTEERHDEQISSRCQSNLLAMIIEILNHRHCILLEIFHGKQSEQSNPPDFLSLIPLFASSKVKNCCQLALKYTAITSSDPGNQRPEKLCLYSSKHSLDSEAPSSW
jgi:hypothetical protein